MIISTLIKNYVVIYKIILLITIQIVFYYQIRNYNKFIINEENNYLQNIPTFYNILNIILSFFVIMSIFNVNLRNFYIFIGAILAFIPFSSQQILKDFICGLLILFITKPYSIGDIIELKNQNLIGTLKETRLFTSVIYDFENKIINVPNSKLYDSIIVNYTKNDIIVQFYEFGINFDSNFVKVKEIIKQSIKQIPVVIPDLTFENIVPCVSINDFKDSKAIVGIRIVVKLEDRFKSKQLVYEAINYLINQNLIQIPYPKLDLKLSQTS